MNLDQIFGGTSRFWIWVFEFLVFTSSRQFSLQNNLYDTTKPGKGPLWLKFCIFDDEFLAYFVETTPNTMHEAGFR